MVQNGARKLAPPSHPDGPGPGSSTAVELLTVGQVAVVLGVAPYLVRRLAKDGKLPCHATEGKHRRFRREVVNQYVRNHTRKCRPALELSCLVFAHDPEPYRRILAEAGCVVHHAATHDLFELGRLTVVCQPHVVVIDMADRALGNSAIRGMTDHWPSAHLAVVAYEDEPHSDEQYAAMGVSIVLRRPLQTQVVGGYLRRLLKS